MANIKLKFEKLTHEEQTKITNGFSQHSVLMSVPKYDEKRLSWLAYDCENNLIGAATTNILWDWIYVDELWVDKACRGQDIGSELLKTVEDYAKSKQCTGVWLWTQSWQAEGFYKKQEFEEFARFPDFPKGHSRIGFRKFLTV